MNNIIGALVAYRDRVLLPQTGIVVSCKAHKTEADIMWLAIKCTNSENNDMSYIFPDGSVVMIDTIVRSDECTVLRM